MTISPEVNVNLRLGLRFWGSGIGLGHAIQGFESLLDWAKHVKWALDSPGAHVKGLQPKAQTVLTPRPQRLPLKQWSPKRVKRVQDLGFRVTSQEGFAV